LIAVNVNDCSSDFTYTDAAWTITVCRHIHVDTRNHQSPTTYNKCIGNHKISW